MTTTNTIATFTAAAIAWTRQAATIYTAIVVVSFTDLIGRRRFSNVALRVDGREGTYRVDMKTLSFEPWEAVDGGEGFRTVAEAKRFARSWQRAACMQSTLSPRDVARPAPRRARGA